MADYIMANPSVVRDQNVLELAAGTGSKQLTLVFHSHLAFRLSHSYFLLLPSTNSLQTFRDTFIETNSKPFPLSKFLGLTSITAGLFAKSVVATDVDRGEILSLLQTNADHNKQSLANCDFKVKELDFFWEEWPSEVTTLAQQSDLILAADVVYDKNITIHFFKTLRKLLAMSPKTALIAIEKRQHAGQDGEVIAPNYEIFLKFLQEMNWSIVGSNMKVAVVNISIDFQQYFNYSRVSELNLFKIQSQLME